ncbi:hypothetical protein EYF80_010178 [Liparis tanakae]|uniref:Uncharacterized protein n=1 Tax=Liparis tanakae TaxID=230148 RepID=A0A4Z2IP06_9TELE|nr:hypothetical protein EYF80_010178 [Liparis tanakae]
MASTITGKRSCLRASEGRSHVPGGGGAPQLAGSSVALRAKPTGAGQSSRRPRLDTPGASTSSPILYSSFFFVAFLKKHAAVLNPRRLSARPDVSVRECRAKGTRFKATGADLVCGDCRTSAITRSVVLQ